MRNEVNCPLLRWFVVLLCVAGAVGSRALQEDIPILGAETYNGKGDNEEMSWVSAVEEGSSVTAACAAAAASGCRCESSYENLAMYLVKCSKKAAKDFAKSIGAKKAKVRYIEADGMVQAAQTNTQSGATWGIDRVDQLKLPLNSIYGYTNTGAGVTAYVLDTGIRVTHAEFATGRATLGVDCVTTAGTCVPGDSTIDGNGHGTHCAGTIGGVVYGVAKGVSLVAVKVLSNSGSGTISGVIAGIDWAAGQCGGSVPKKCVANLSLGGGFSSSLNDAVNRASLNSGVVMVVAAGNNNADACNVSPASAAEAITVGATTSTDAKASYSNYGRCLDIFAPGSSVTSAWYTGDATTDVLSGTSMAAPHVAGVVALMLETCTDCTPRAIVTRLQNDATVRITAGFSSKRHRTDTFKNELLFKQNSL